MFYQTTTNDNTIFTTLGPDGPCCNTCDIDYPQADILYWPVQTTDTWCLQFGATSPPPVTIGSVKGSILPAVLPESTRLPVYGNLARKDRKIRRASTTITSAPSQLARKGRAIARRTHLPEGESYAVGADVFTFISPCHFSHERLRPTWTRLNVPYRIIRTRRASNSRWPELQIWLIQPCGPAMCSL